MGLVVFDEAFNTLDTPNTAALMDYSAGLNPQVIVAAPDKVRSTFSEIVNTIVTVRRNPSIKEPLLSVSHRAERAKREIASLNPLHMAVEASRDLPSDDAKRPRPRDEEHLDPVALLNALLDSHERRSDTSRAVTTMPSLSFPDGETRARLKAGCAAPRRRGRSRCGPTTRYSTPAASRRDRSSPRFTEASNYVRSLLRWGDLSLDGIRIANRLFWVTGIPEHLHLIPGTRDVARPADDIIEPSEDALREHSLRS